MLKMGRERTYKKRMMRFDEFDRLIDHPSTIEHTENLSGNRGKCLSGIDDKHDAT